MNPDHTDLPEKNTLAYDRNFARVESVDGDCVTLSYDLDPDVWPWLALPPRHPVLIEKYQYFSSVTAGWASGRFPPSTYSALTRFNWSCPAGNDRDDYGARGLCINRATEDGSVMDIDIYSQTDEHLVHMECEGFAFEDRDFRAWRAHSRDKALARNQENGIDYISAEPLDPDSENHRLISRLQTRNGQPMTRALVTSANGFHPHHPFHTGSGDHVNVGHYFDCVLQMAHLLTGASQPLQCVGGESSFSRFIELDVPFEILLISEDDASGVADVTLGFSLSQLGEDNARISLHLNNI